jgi:uncharacterized SAM-binding protein YcdF (DUF218 family)
MTFVVSKILWFVVQPSNLVALMIAAGVGLGFTKRFPAAGLRLAAAGALALLIGGLTPLASIVILPLEQRFPRLDVTPGSTAFAGIIVLGGAEDGRVSKARGQLHLNEAAERITEGARLARLLPEARLVFTGGAALPMLGHVEGAEPVGVFWQAMGVEPKRITLEHRSRNTHENALFTRDIVQPKQGERWLLVTSAAHMPRSMGVFRRAGFEVAAYPVDFRTPGVEEAREPFGSVTGGLRRLDDATKEWIGLIAYWLLGRTSALFPGPT